MPKQELNPKNVRFIHITPESISHYPGVICFINAKHPCFHQKVDWFCEQYKLGLRIIACCEQSSSKVIGFIEYVPVENCWRPVSGSNSIMIHCLWTNGKAIQHQGIGKTLLEMVEQEARVSSMDAICTITSDGSFMADRTIFEKQGFIELDHNKKEQLMVKQFTDSTDITIQKDRINPANYSGITFIYTGQCPWISRFVVEVQPLLKELNLPSEIIELKTPAEAQRAPSLYGSFNLIIGGKIVADRNVSLTRFKNILKKELGISVP